MTLDEARELVPGQLLIHRPTGKEVNFVTVREANARSGLLALVECSLPSGTTLLFLAKNLDTTVCQECRGLTYVGTGNAERACPTCQPKMAAEEAREIF